MESLDNLLTGLMTINGKDAWTEYHVFLAEKNTAHINMDSLLRMPKAKDVTVVDFRERTGVDLPENVNIKLSTIDRTLQFCLVADSDQQRLSLYREFLNILVSGKLEINIKDYRNYKMLYKDMPSDPEWYNAFDKQYYITIFQIKFLDYEPS